MALQPVRFPAFTVRSRHWLRRSAAAARAIGFWLAVALPLAYLPAVVLAPAAVANPTVLASLVGGNLVALLIGHGHEPSTPGGRPDEPEAGEPGPRHSHGCPPGASGHSGYQ